MDENYKQMMRQTLKMAGMSALEQCMQNPFAGMGGNYADMLYSDSYFEFAENPTINKSYQWAVACGADLIHLRADVINDLTTGADSLKSGRHSVIYQRLAAGEDITNYEDGKYDVTSARKRCRCECT